MRLQLRVRRFVCSNPLCRRRTFAERLGEQIKASARRTKRCESQLQTIGLMLGGNAGARLAKLMGMSVSSDTLLRLIRALEVPKRAVPEVLGIDDFALRKGQKYGTVLVDLERQHKEWGMDERISLCSVSAFSMPCSIKASSFPKS